MELTLGWLYYDLMNTYGDRGNILILKNRAEKRNIKVKIIQFSVDSEASDLNKADLLFMGGAEDRQQQIVAKDLVKDKKDILISKINAGIPGLFICGAYQFLGKYYQTADNVKIPGLGLLPFYTIQTNKDNQRLIGDIVVKMENKTLLHSDYFKNSFDQLLIGFENHGGSTFLDKDEALVTPIGKAIKGFGNNGRDLKEGAVFLNTVGTYLHGPVLPKNPKLADFFIAKALELKYNQPVILNDLDDTLYKQNRNYLLKKLNVKN